MSGLTAVGVPVLPFWLLIVRGVAIVLSLGVLIASAYHLSITPYSNFTFTGAGLTITSGPPGFLIFDAIFTWIILGCMIGFEFLAQKLYYRVVFISLLLLDALFWLSAWAWGASWAAWQFTLIQPCEEDMDSLFGIRDCSIYDEYNDSVKALGGSLAAATALGAFTWILIIVTTIFFIISCHRDSSNGPTVAMQGSELENANKQGGTHYVQPVPAQSPPPQQAPAPGQQPYPVQGQQYPVQGQQY